MNQLFQRYTFDSQVNPDDVRAALLLALWGTESLHGETNVRLEANYFFDPDQQICTIEENIPVGRDLNLLFLGFLIRELGSDAFETERVDHSETKTVEPEAKST